MDAVTIGIWQDCVVMEWN